MKMMMRTLGRNLEVWWTTQGVQAELEAQSKSSSSLPRSPRPPCTKSDAQITYGLGFGHSRYVRKANKKVFPMSLVWGTKSLGVNGNHPNKLMYRICSNAMTLSFVFGPCIILEPIRDASRGVLHELRLLINISLHTIRVWILLKLFCQNSFTIVSVC